MEQAIINVEGTTTIETAAAAKKLIEMFGNRNIRAIAVNRVNDKSDEVIVELDFVPGLAPHHASGKWLDLWLCWYWSFQSV